MNCSYGEKLILYFYGETDAPLKDSVEAHLKSCAACRGELAALSAAEAWLKIETDGPSPAVIAAVLKQAESVRNAGMFGVFDWRGALLAGALTAVMAVGFSLSVRGSSQGLAWNSGLESGLDAVEYSLYQEQSGSAPLQSDWEYNYGLLEAESQQGLG